MREAIEISSRVDPELKLKVIPGHFSSDRFHMNYYVDLGILKTRQRDADQVARAMCKKYISQVQLKGSYHMGSELEQLQSKLMTKAPIDTIVCLDGSEVIGAYMAHELSQISEDKFSFTRRKDFYVISPEFDSTGQMVVRDNIRPMFEGKNVLIVLATAMSGNTILKSIRCIESYNGKVEGISVIFGAVESIDGHPVHAVFDAKDLPDFKLSEPEECEECREGIRLDAIVNSYGYTKL